MELPASLRTWFIVDFVFSATAGILLLLAPGIVLPWMGWQTIDPLASRLVGAALFSIGLASLRARNQGPEVYRSLLALKISWSGTAVLASLVALVRGAPTATFGVTAVFVAFFGIWSSHVVRLRQYTRGFATLDDDPNDDPR